ncbi:MAG: PaaI family thioesterase [Pseudomonadota bacterium]
MTTDPDAKLASARRFIEALPHCRALNMVLKRVADGEAVMSMPYDKRLVGDPATGVIHGGAVSTLMDTCGGTAVMAHNAGPATTATLNLRIDYMRAATPGQAITATATCYHLTRSVAFVRAVAMDEDTDKPVATAAGAFTVQGVS